MEASGEYTETHPSPDQPRRPKLAQKWKFNDPAAVEFRRIRRLVFVWAAGLIAVVAIGWATVSSGADERARQRAYAAAVEADLIRLTAAQDAFHEVNQRFASLAELGLGYISSQGVTVDIHAADRRGWNASAWHVRSSRGCTITGGVGPATIADQSPGEPTCRR